MKCSFTLLSALHIIQISVQAVACSQRPYSCFGAYFCGVVDVIGTVVVEVGVVVAVDVF